MTSRALAIASLLMLTAAVLTEPSFAATGVGTSSVDLEPDRPAGGQLPPPTHPDSLEIVPGAAPLDLQELVDSYATVTRHADGRTTVAPPSPDLREAIEREYASGRI